MATNGGSLEHPTIIDLIRHADVHNPRDVFYGRLPRFGLSDLGRQQARLTAERLAGEPLAAIYTSPMLRARQTATMIAAGHPHRPPVRQAAGLIEVRSHWQGRPTAELDAIQFNFFDYAHEGDETIPMIFERLNRLLQRLRISHLGQHIACISHADPIAIARAGLAGRPLITASIRNQPDYPAKTSISRLIFTGEPRPQIQYLPPD